MVIHSEPKSLYATQGNDADENIRIRDQLAPETDQYGYKIKEQPMGTKRNIKVILMGAGKHLIALSIMEADACRRLIAELLQKGRRGDGRAGDGMLREEP